MYNKYLKPPQKEKLANNPDLPNTFICDLDGTLALIGDRDPYDASTANNDELNESVNIILDSMKKSGIYPILISGREDKYLGPTIEFLNKNNIEYNNIYLRKTGDYRKDSVIKKELYEKHIKDKYNVLFVLDDRNQVVNMWREQGLTCFQVEEGNF